MKNLRVTIATAMIVFLCISCQESIDVEKETAAIKAVIQKSGDAWVDRDYESMEEVWLQDKIATRISANVNGYGIFESWESLANRYKNAFENNPEPLASKEVFVNHRMRIFTDVAYANVDRYILSAEGDTIQKSLHTYILEKPAGQWKIANLSTIFVWVFDLEDDNIEVSNTYHKLNPYDVEMVLSDDFTGHDEIGGTWTKAGHKNFLTNNKGNVSDSIIYQMANGNTVATVFLRKGTVNGEMMEGEAMQIKDFEDGKISEIWEYGFGVFKQ